MTAAAREISRLRYLAAMGVTPLVTRRVLPGAAPTQKLALRDTSHRDAAPVDEAPSVAPGGSSAPRELRDMLKSGSADGNKGRDTEPASRTAAQSSRRSPPREAAAAVETFRLSAIVCGGRLWIEDLGDGALAREQLDLVTNMARALTHPETPEAPTVHQFDWPMHNNEHLNLGQEEAAASLQGFLMRQLDEHACVELICLGDGARERARSLNLPCASLSLPTTRELLEEPRRKRDVWRDLRRP